MATPILKEIKKLKRQAILFIKLKGFLINKRLKRWLNQVNELLILIKKFRDKPYDSIDKAIMACEIGLVSDESSIRLEIQKLISNMTKLIHLYETKKILSLDSYGFLATQEELEKIIKDLNDLIKNQDSLSISGFFPFLRKRYAIRVGRSITNLFSLELKRIL